MVFDLMHRQLLPEDRVVFPFEGRLHTGTILTFEGRTVPKAVVKFDTAFYGLHQVTLKLGRKLKRRDSFNPNDPDDEYQTDRLVKIGVL